MLCWELTCSPLSLDVTVSVSEARHSMAFLHGPVQTAHWDKFAFCISPPSLAIVRGDRLVGGPHCDAQRRIEDEQNVDPNSGKNMHR